MRVSEGPERGEADVLPRLDRWLVKIFDPANLDDTLDQLIAARPDTDPDSIAHEKILADYDRKLARYRAALDAGTHPTIVNEWIKQVQAERAAVESRSRLGRLRKVCVEGGT